MNPKPMSPRSIGPKSMGLDGRVSRRAVLMGLGAGTLTLAASALLAACGGAPATPTQAPKTEPAKEPPKPTAAPAAAAPAPTPAPQAEAPKPAQPAPTPAAKPAAQPVEKYRMEYWTWADPDTIARLNKRAAEYMAKNPEVEIVNVPGPSVAAEYVAKFETAAAAGKAPDVFWGDESSWFRWACNEVYLDQKPYFDQLGIDPKKTWHAQAQWWFRGKYLGTSRSLQTFAVFYNYDAFKKAGLPEPPFTVENAWKWDEFVATARKLTVDAGGKHPGESGFDASKIQFWGVMPAKYNWSAMNWFWQSDLYPFGKGYDKVQVTDPEISGVFQKLCDLSGKERVAPVPADLGGTTGLAMFLTGKIAMYMDGQWANRSLTKEPPKFDLRLAVIPVMGKRYLTWVTGAPSAVWSKSKRPDLAVKFAISALDIQSNIEDYQIGGALPTQTEWFSGEKRKQWLDNFPQHHPPHYPEVTLGTLDHSEDMDWKRWQGFYEAWHLIIGPSLDPVWLGQKSAKDAMAEIAPRLNEVVAKNLKPCTPIAWE